MICETYRALLNKRRFLSFIKYRKYIKRKPRGIVNLLKKKLKSGLFKDLNKKIFLSFLFRNPTKKVKHVPRTYFFKYRVSVKHFCSNLLYLYFSLPSFSNSIFSQIKNMRSGDKVYIQVSRHLNLSDVSFFDDFFEDFYFGILDDVNMNGSSSSFILKQYVYDVAIKHNFYATSPNIIILERVHEQK